MNLLPAEGRDALFHIIANTVCEGLPDRIRFLLPKEEEADAPPDGTSRSNRKERSET